MDQQFISLPTGVRLAYVEHGSPDGIPLVLLHGVTDSWRSFEPVLAHLPASLHAFAISQRGHGDSSRPDEGYTFADMAGDLAAFIDALAIERPVVVGHSMGASVAMRFAIDHPDRLRALVLLGAFATMHRHPMITEYVTYEIAPLEDPIPMSFARDFQSSTLARDIAPTFLDVVVGESLKVPARVWKATFEGFLDTPDFSSGLATVAVPTLLMWGDRDAYALRGDQERLLAAVGAHRDAPAAGRAPRAQLLTYPGAGHAVHWEAPEGVARDLEAFIRDSLSTP